MEQSITKNELLSVARLCNLAYSENQEVKEMYNNIKQEIPVNNDCACALSTLLKCPQYYEGDYNDCEFYSCVDKNRNLLIIFRGTESARDILTDLNASRSKLTIPNIKEKKFPYVHSGFKRQFDSVKSKLDKVINSFITNKGYFNKKTITFGGHSLGGALATISSLYYYHQFKYYNVNVNCVTLGSPRVGGSGFCKLFDNTINNSYRFVNKNDIVTMIPTRWRFRHVKGLQWFDNNELKSKMESRLWDSIKSSCIDWFGSSNPQSSSFVDDHSCNLYLQKMESLL